MLRCTVIDDRPGRGNKVYIQKMPKEQYDALMQRKREKAEKAAKEAAAAEAANSESS